MDDAVLPEEFGALGVVCGVGWWMVWLVDGVGVDLSIHATRRSAQVCIYMHVRKKKNHLRHDVAQQAPERRVEHQRLAPAGRLQDLQQLRPACLVRGLGSSPMMICMR